jgi:uncharacterized protein HemX
LALIIVVLLIAGYIYYLFHKKKSHAKKQQKSTLNREIKDLSMEAIKRRQQQAQSNQATKESTENKPKTSSKEK